MFVEPSFGNEAIRPTRVFWARGSRIGSMLNSVPISRVRREHRAFLRRGERIVVTRSLVPAYFLEPAELPGKSRERPDDWMQFLMPMTDGDKAAYRGLRYWKNKRGRARVMSNRALEARDAKRDIGAELLWSVREMKGQLGRAAF